VTGRVAVARSGAGAVLLKGSGDLVPAQEGPSAGSEIRQHGATSRWIVRVCEAGDLKSVESRFAALAVTEEADGTWTIEDPDYGTVRFLADGSVEAEGRRLLRSDYTVAGDATMI
jgi:hypothetical protein